MNPITIVTDLLGPAGLGFGTPQAAGSLTVVPVHHRLPATGYRLFADVAGAGAHIEEVSAGGSVPELQVVNRTDDPVLLVEGEVLIGLKQNRTLNTSVLVPAGATVVIPVACVEAGRWYRTSDRATSAGYHVSPEVRSAKNLGVQARVRTSGRFDTDQLLVWDHVADRLSRHAAASPSGDYGEVHRSRRADIGRLIGRLRPEDGAAGVLAMIGRRPAALDVFDRPDTLRSLWRPLVASYAADALVEGGAAEERHIKEARDWVHELAAGAATLHAAVGAGEVIQISGRAGIVSALVAGRTVMHLAALPGWAPATSDPRFRRPSRRGPWFETRAASGPDVGGTGRWTTR